MPIILQSSLIGPCWCKRKCGLALVELLVVIAIISILAAIMLPVLNQFKTASKQSVCLSNARQLAFGVNLYATDFDDHFPMGGWESDDNSTVSSRWYLDIVPYTKSIQIRNCPSSPYKVSDLHNWRSDYGLNISLARWENWATGLPGTQIESNVKSPSNLVMLSDTAQYDHTTFPTSPDNLDPALWLPHSINSTDYQVEGPYDFYSQSRLGYDYPYSDPPAPTGDNFRRPYALHHGQVNVVFCDDHAKSIGIRALVGPMPYGFALNDPRNLWSNF